MTPMGDSQILTYADSHSRSVSLFFTDCDKIFVKENENKLLILILLLLLLLFYSPEVLSNLSNEYLAEKKQEYRVFFYFGFKIM